MQPRYIQTQEIHVVGVSVKTNNTNESDPTTAQIPIAWNQFFAGNIVEQVPNSLIPGRPLGVYTHYEANHAGDYEFVVGLEVEELTSVPEGLVGVTIPPGNYFIFSVQGKIPNIVAYTWNYICQYFADNSTYERDYTTDFELYKPEDQVDLYVSVRDKPQTIG